MALADSLEEARHSLVLKERMETRKGGLRGAWLRLKRDTQGRVRLSGFRRALLEAGIPCSQAQADAFLAPMKRKAAAQGASARGKDGEVLLSWRDFVSLGQSRGVLPPEIAAATRERLGQDSQALGFEGLGRFGVMEGGNNDPMRLPEARDRVAGAEAAAFAAKSASVLGGSSGSAGAADDISGSEDPDRPQGMAARSSAPASVIPMPAPPRPTELSREASSERGGLPHAGGRVPTRPTQRGKGEDSRRMRAGVGAGALLQQPEASGTEHRRRVVDPRTRGDDGLGHGQAAGGPVPAAD